MYRVFRYVIKPSDALFEYCDQLTHLSNNLYNASLFRIRQMLTYFQKEIPSKNEQEIYNEIVAALPGMNQTRSHANMKRAVKAKLRHKDPVQAKLFELPEAKRCLLSFSFLDALMKETRNPDYCSDLPKHSAQAAIKRACLDVKNYFKALRAYRKDPSKFKAEPQLPGYKKRGGHCLVTLSNQECSIYGHLLKLPKTKVTLALGSVLPPKSRLKQVEIHPYYGNFRITIVLDDGIKDASKPISEKPTRIAAIDFGVDNLAAISNNAGLPGLLFKGGIIKAENQWYNKRRAEIVHGITVGHPALKNPTSRSLQRLSQHRDGVMNTEIHTCAKKIIRWCVDNSIDTLVLGHDKEWKQAVSMGKNSNQTFCSIPFGKLRWCLTYMAQHVGIRIVNQEESFTSKASFLDMDDMPVYGEENGIKPRFSGYRKSRGQYRSRQKNKLVHADLNAAGNILRKAFPDAFSGHSVFPFLDHVIVM